MNNFPRAAYYLFKLSSDLSAKSLSREMYVRKRPKKRTMHTCHVTHFVTPDRVGLVLGGRPPGKTPRGRHQMTRRWLPDP